MSELHRTDVVTAFIRQAGRILLLQRSDQVGSYRGCWGGVSGYLEDATPLAQALREIHEETGLDAGDVRLSAQAAPLEVTAPELNKLWVVHPFLFDLTASPSVRLDWESMRCQWLEPERIGELDTVPMLAEALQACLTSEQQHVAR